MTYQSTVRKRRSSTRSKQLDYERRRHDGVIDRRGVRRCLRGAVHTFRNAVGTKPHRVGPLLVCEDLDAIRATLK